MKKTTLKPRTDNFVLPEEKRKLRWYNRYDANVTKKVILYAESSQGQWDGDETGKEWVVGFCIFLADKNMEKYNLYEDDGTATGKWISSYDSLIEAFDAAEKADAKLNR